ncbi:MAG: prephenate dehydratase [Winogradskyella sp.]|nr:prephenate dehydratase [Winogradskyella sp.]NNK40106.1 prephenate dehydratase [Winogradskyella sp.]NNL83342.1 prephenate dehydratase [Winogradskyella sp.]
MINAVAIQGVVGSFHYIVAREFFGSEMKILECLTFDSAIDSLFHEETDAVVMAIENSIAGSIIPNYALIDTNEFYIVGEYYLDIQHHLMALNNQDIDSINEVHSHPMALLQCKSFLKKYPHIKLVEAKDTAEVAMEIAEKKLEGVAAIGSEMAAQHFGLKILAKSIQTISHNETRFVIVKRGMEELNGQLIDKASLKFDVDHKRGSLAAILNVMSDCKLNLTKIQSLPKIETPWKYAFFVDVTFATYKDFEKAKSILSIMAENFKILGEYKNERK